jgi:hypothetical protein
VVNNFRNLQHHCRFRKRLPIPDLRYHCPANWQSSPGRGPRNRWSIHLQQTTWQTGGPAAECNDDDGARPRCVEVLPNRRPRAVVWRGVVEPGEDSLVLGLHPGGQVASEEETSWTGLSSALPTPLVYYWETSALVTLARCLERTRPCMNSAAPSTGGTDGADIDQHSASHDRLAHNCCRGGTGLPRPDSSGRAGTRRLEDGGTHSIWPGLHCDNHFAHFRPSLDRKRRPVAATRPPASACQTLHKRQRPDLDLRQRVHVGAGSAASVAGWIVGTASMLNWLNLLRRGTSLRRCAGSVAARNGHRPRPTRPRPGTRGAMTIVAGLSAPPEGSATEGRTGGNRT